jgi:acetyl/propionyl-CoA carboxylase alpha subunit
MKQDFQRVAVINRGEATMRFIHAAREFNYEHGTALRTIALFTEPDFAVSLLINRAARE